METADGEPFADNGLMRARLVIGSTPSRSDRIAISSLLSSQSKVGGFFGFSSLRGAARGVEVALFLEDDPGEAGELVGERDGGLVVAAGLFETESPAP